MFLFLIVLAEARSAPSQYSSGGPENKPPDLDEQGCLNFPPHIFGVCMGGARRITPSFADERSEFRNSDLLCFGL